MGAAPRVRGKIKLHGRPAGRPYDRTYICNLPFLFAICGRSLRPPAKAGGNGDAAPRVRGKIKLHGRPTGRPYDLTGISIYDFVRNFRKAVGRGLDPAAAQFGRRGFGVCRTRTRCM